jgi:hypothetical protein
MAKAVIKFVMEISLIFLYELSKSYPESLSFYPSDIILVTLCDKAYGQLLAHDPGVIFGSCLAHGVVRYFRHLIKVFFSCCIGLNVICLSFVVPYLRLFLAVYVRGVL